MSQELSNLEQGIHADDLESQRKNFAQQIENICSDYGLHGTVLLHRPSPIEGSRRNKMYLIASRDPLIAADTPPLDFDPEYYLRRNMRNERLVYTDVFVHELGPNSNRMAAMEDLIEYCKYTEFLTTLYARYKLEPPLKLRRFEIRQLMDARSKQKRVQMDGIWRSATEALNEFFEDERKAGVQKEWLSFFRSEKYPDRGGAFEKLRAFRNRNNPEISLEQLMACNGNINSIEMQEHEYHRFADFMRKTFPDVPYAVSKKAVIDNGSGPRTPDIEREYGKRVTGEEYDRIRDERFASEGWECIMDLVPARFEIRKVFFAAVDEPYIAAAFHDASLRFAKTAELPAIEARGGSLRRYAFPKEPQEAFMNFISLAKSNQLPFHIDTMGSLETPSLSKINVIYSSRDEDLFFDILDRIVDETVDIAHLISDEERPALQELLTSAEHLPKPKQGRGAAISGSHERA